MTKKLPRFGRRLASYKGRGLGVFLDNGKIYLFYQTDTRVKPRPRLAKESVFQIDRSPDGLEFGLYDDSAEITIGKIKKEQIKNCSDFRVSAIGDKYFLTYKLSDKSGSSLQAATSSNLVHWQKTGKIATPGESGMLVPDFKYQGRYVLYFGERLLSVATSSDFKTWKLLGNSTPRLPVERKGYAIKVANLMTTGEEILLIYYQYKEKGEITYSLKAAAFNRQNPKKLLWDKVIWKQRRKWKKLTSPLGTVLLNNKLISYWQEKDGEISTLLFPYFATILQKIEPVFVSPIINKFRDNPILTPIINHFWESKAVFNPTAFYDEGKVHIVYRAVGEEDVSTLGYAASLDGVTIDERHKKPIYIPTQPFEGGQQNPHAKRADAQVVRKKAKSPFVSGPGWGGVEDPRITKIDGKLYMTYIAFDGVNPPGVALTSIAVADFHQNAWNWREPVLLSRPGEAHKNWVIFPEKINGEYAILHSITPNISIDYFDTLEFDNRVFIKSYWKPIKRRGRWDSWLRGAGPPPIKTKDGWLLFYHAMAEEDPGKYKLGAMLLDYNNPEKILYRSRTPVLEPDEEYENAGFKAGVIFACGAVVLDGKLIIYYGGSDQFVCAAEADLERFLAQLKSSGQSRLIGAKVKNPEYLH